MQNKGIQNVAQYLCWFSSGNSDKDAINTEKWKLLAQKLNRGAWKEKR